MSQFPNKHMYCPVLLFSREKTNARKSLYQKIGEKNPPIYFYNLSANVARTKRHGAYRTFGSGYNPPPKPPCGGLNRQNVIKQVFTL